MKQFVLLYVGSEISRNVGWVAMVDDATGNNDNYRMWANGAEYIYQKKNNAIDIAMDVWEETIDIYVDTDLPTWIEDITHSECLTGNTYYNTDSKGKIMVYVSGQKWDMLLQYPKIIH